ncbi:MAG: extracellular solute-binding protein, partial [Clostridiales bacterium]|nr:extracellular solute-binding protein [Clostridiales bacterium]
VVQRALNKKMAEDDLEAATINVWFSVKDGSSEEDAMKEVFTDFKSKFTKVNIEYRAIPESQYLNEINAAKASGNMPDLYESTDLPDSVLENAADLEKVINSEQFDECLFLNQYDQYYTSKKKMPLAIEIPVAYVITSGYFETTFDNTYFSQLSDFDAAANLAVDSRYAGFLDDNFEIGGYVDQSAFLNGTENSSAVLLSSSMIINEVRNLPYEKKYVYCNNSDLKCRFTYEWSVSPSEKNRQRAAETLLSWMLGNVYQRTLMVNTGTNAQIPEIPVNEECFKTKMQYLKNLEPITEIYKNFIFRKEES